MEKEKCSCGDEAKWCYLPGYISGGNPYHCDDCVPRGCECMCSSDLDALGRQYPCVEYDYSAEGYEKEEINE